MTDSQYLIVVEEAGREMAQRCLGEGQFLIGRDPGCAICVPIDSVSLQHVRVTINAREIVLEDLGSAHGTYVDEVPIRGPVTLLSQQTVRLGTVILRLIPIESAGDTLTASALRAAAASDDVTRMTPPESLVSALPISAATAALQPARNYEIGERHATGGMGAILVARDRNIGRPVAMKVMIGDQRTQLERVMRFIDEAKVTGQLEHANIVPVHELGVNETGKPFYTMKFVQGVTLKQVLEEIAEGGRHETLAHLLTVFQKVCDAMAFAHSRGIVHRDLKPENVMVGEYGEVLVMDWGLHKVLSEQSKPAYTGQTLVAGANIDSSRGKEHETWQTLDGSILGTPSFMAPEQANGQVEVIDGRSDIYALGAILYNILTLQPPVMGEAVEDVLRKVRTGQFPAPVDVPGPFPHCPGGRIPESLAAVAMKALALRTADRYQTVKELQAEIEAYQGGFATGAENASLLKQLWLLVNRHKREFIIVSAALLVLVVGALLFMVRVTQERNRAERERNRAESERARAETEKQRAQAETARAERTLAELQGTAPTFFRQAQTFIKGHDFTKALEMIQYAITLAPNEADYRVLEGNIDQSLLRLADAHEAYRQALARQPGQALAAENLKICERILQENQGQTNLTAASLVDLQTAMRQQGRFDEAVAILQPLDENRQRLVDAWHNVLKKAGWNNEAYRISIDPKGLLGLELLEVPSIIAVSDLSAIKGMPLTKLEFSSGSRTMVADLTPLKGMPLREFLLQGQFINNLEPLRGMPLECLHLNNSPPVSDLSPLTGMPLKTLTLVSIHVRDLSPLKGLPLHSLILNAQLVTDLSALQGMPLTNLSLTIIPIKDLHVLKGMPLEVLNVWNCANLTNLEALQGMPLKGLSLGRGIEDLRPLKGLPLQWLSLGPCQLLRDLTPLADCRELEELVIPPQVKDIEVLRRLPKLKRLGFGTHDAFYQLPPATEFWKTYDAQHAQP